MILDEVARVTKLPAASVEATLQLLDDGNTVAFITRYRKDQTVGLDEDQIRTIEREAGFLRQLAARKSTILKSIEAQGKLTPELRQAVDSAISLRRLEDLYLPFKAKKQTLATIARERGLAPLAEQILRGEFGPIDLEARSAAFVDPDKAPTSADVKAGVATSDRRAIQRACRYSRAGSTDPWPNSGVSCLESRNGGRRIRRDPGATANRGRSLCLDGPAEESLSVRQRKRQKLERALQDYFGFRERLDRIRPPPRVGHQSW